MSGRRGSRRAGREGSAVLLGLALLSAVPACAATPGEKLRADVTAFRKEGTPDKLFERGRAFASVGDMTRAEEYLAAAMEGGYDERKVVPILLRVCIQDHRYRVAIQYADRYLAKHPQDAGTRYILGTLYAAVGEPTAARVELQRVLKAQPAQADVHYTLGVLLRDQQEDLAEADGHFREYLRLAPAGPHAEEARASLLKEVPHPELRGP